jgi:hypothetical protein
MSGLAENALNSAMMNVSLQLVVSIETKSAVPRLETEEIENGCTCPIRRA